MKRMIVLAMVAAIVSVSQAEWTLLDNFDSYAAGDAATVTGGIWSSETNDSTVEVTADGTLHINKLAGSGGWDGTVTDLTGTTAAIAVGETKTYFWQVKVLCEWDTTSWSYDCMMGLSLETTNIDQVDAWRDFAIMPFVNNATNTPYINADAPTSPWWAPMTKDVWTNVWIVVRNDATDPDFDLYYSEGDAPAILVAGNAYWRNLTAGSALNAFSFMAGGWDMTHYTFDNIYYTEGEVLSNPTLPLYYDAPLDGADLIPVELNASENDLVFTVADFAIADVEVYLTPDPNADVLIDTLTGVTPQQYTIDLESQLAPDTSLAYGTTYSWRVIGYEPNSVSGQNDIPVPGPIWSFTTVPSVPSIVTQPKSITVGISETAQFSLTALNAEMYEWYKVNDAGSDTLVGSGAAMNTLEIPNVQPGDEGQYYCTVNNSEGSTDSAIVSLWTKRLMGWWKLDDNAADSVNLEVEGVPAHDGILPADPNFVSGKDNSGFEFFGDGTVIEMADSAEFFNFYPFGYSVSAWVKTTQSGGWGAYVSKQSQDPARGFILTHGGTPAVHTLRQSFNDLYGSDVTDGIWHHVVGTYDGQTGTGRIYVDGVRRNEAINTNTVSPGPNPLIFGAELPTGEIAYAGVLDDVRIWSYPLEPIDVAGLYLEFNPDEKICIEQDDPWRYYDVVGEPGESSYCRIDIDDFAEFASLWMMCNIVPDCLP